MAFNIFKWILQKTDGDASDVSQTVQVGSFLDEQANDVVIGLEVYLQRIAFWTCVRRIGDAVGSVEWETYRRGNKVKAAEYWSWNYNPNPNQTRKEFFDKLIAQLYQRNEALVVETRNGYRYVADAYATDKHLTGDIYRDISSDGETIPGVFSSDAVLHFKLSGDNARRMMAAIAAAEGQLIKSAAASYIRNSGKHGILTVDDIAEADPDFEETYADLVNNKFKKYFTSENAVLPLFNGYHYDEKDSDGSGTTTANTRDIRALMDDIIELTATALGLPSSIAKGAAVTDADFKAFMTSPVQPVVTMITEEINRKLYGQQRVLAGTYIVPNLGAVRYNDLFDVANPIDKLIGSGAFCVNDVRIRLGLDAIDEPWAWQHWMTKNYSPAQDLLEGVDNTSTPAATSGEKEESNEQGNETDGSDDTEPEE